MGEVVVVNDAEIVDLTLAEARQVTSRIRNWAREFPAVDVKSAYVGRAWRAMGYDSWAEWCDCELDGFLLPAPKRQEVVVELAEIGMSNTAIAKVVGVSHMTVSRDRRSGVTNVRPEPVVGIDGKTYRRPPATGKSGDRPGATRFSKNIQKASASLVEKCESLSDEEIAEALGAAQFLYQFLLGETKIRESKKGVGQ